jgi:O-acetylserine/cysteine efflux transporter
MVWFFKPPERELGKLFVIAFISASFQFALTYFGFQLLPISTAVILVQSEVPFLVLLAFFILGQRLRSRQLSGVIISLIGSFIILGTPSLEGELLGMILVLLGAFMWALGQVAIAWVKSIDGFRLATWVGAMAAVQLWCGTLLIEGDPRPALASLDAVQITSLVFIGIGPGAIGMGLWYQLVARVGASHLSPFLLLIPVISVAEGVIFLGDVLSPMTMFGGSVTLVGVMLALQPDRTAARRSTDNVRRQKECQND